MSIEETLRTYILADEDVASLTQGYTPYYQEQTTANDPETVRTTIVVRMDKQSGALMQQDRMVTALVQVFCFAGVKDTALALSEAVRKRIDQKRFTGVDYALWQSDDDGFDEPLRSYYQMAVYQIEYFQNQ